MPQVVIKNTLSNKPSRDRKNYERLGRNRKITIVLQSAFSYMWAGCDSIHVGGFGADFGRGGAFQVFLGRKVTYAYCVLRLCLR